MQPAACAGRLGAGRPCRPTPAPFQAHRGKARKCVVRRVSAQEGDLEADWEQEMSIFKARTLKPSQLEVQAKLAAEKVDVGRVREQHR